MIKEKKKCELLSELHMRNSSLDTTKIWFYHSPDSSGGPGAHRSAGLTRPESPALCSCVGFRAGPNRPLRHHFQCHPPLFTDPQSPTQTLGFKRVQEKGALVILPAHPRKPGQAWQHHSFKASLSAPAQGHCCGHRATGPRRPGLVARGHHCPRLRADSTLKLRPERGKMDSGDRGAPPTSRPEVSMERPTLDAGGTAHVLISGHSRFQQPKKQRSLFPFPTLSGQEGEGEEAWQVTAERAGPGATQDAAGQGKGQGMTQPDPCSPSDRGTLTPWRGKEGP